MTSRTGSARRIWGILKKSVELSLDVRRRKVTFACSPRPWGGVARDGGGVDRWKSQNRKNVYLSPYVEEPLNSKVSYLNWEVASVFRVSRFLCSMYIYIWTLYVHLTYPYLAMVQNQTKPNQVLLFVFLHTVKSCQCGHWMQTRRGVPGVMDDRDGWRGRLRGLRAISLLWWLWFYKSFLFLYFLIAIWAR